jgi:hypothetical protein
MVGNHGESLVALTPAVTGFASMEDFVGCSTPGLDQVPLTEADIDEPLFGALSRAWQEHFVEGQRCPVSRALFRSIAAAHDALRLPGGHDVTAEDFGRLSVAWTSAFETLVWPLRKHASCQDVITVIDGIEWKSSRLKAECRSWTEKGKPCCVSHPAWIYRCLDKLRNDYAHGNEIDDAEHADHSVIVRIAAVLFRCLLADRLGVWCGKSVPFAGDIKQFVDAHLQQGEVTKGGLPFEKALLWYRGRSVLMRPRVTSAPA